MEKESSSRTWSATIWDDVYWRVHGNAHVACRKNSLMKDLRWQAFGSQDGGEDLGHTAEQAMEQDHYAVLGVAPAAEQAANRVAYRALMRRYHPDAGASAEAAEQARAINLAYAVLRDPEKRSRYDGSLGSRRALRFEPAGETSGERGGKRFCDHAPDRAASVRLQFSAREQARHERETG